MTRINLVHPSDLADQHLFAEWRESKMIPALLRKVDKNSYWDIIAKVKDLPPTYTLSTGHVRFFYNKLGWLYLRFQNLTRELRNREYNIPDDFDINAYGIFLHSFPNEFVGNDWKPSREDIRVNTDRIIERLNQKPNWYRYYGEIKPPEFFIQKYSQQLLVDTLTT